MYLKLKTEDALLRLYFFAGTYLINETPLDLCFFKKTKKFFFILLLIN